MVALRLGAAKLVFVVADGDLHLVSLGALPAVGEGYLLEQGPTLHYLTAERDIVPQDEEEVGTGLLLVGDPNFERAATGFPESWASTGLFRGGRSGCEGLATAPFERWGGTRREIREVRRAWRRTQRDEVLVLEGAAADEGRVKLAMAGKRVVHLATHGFFLGECASALDGRRGIGTMISPGGMDPPGPPTGENPLLLSGLALAGANRRDQARPGEEDGVLTAEELGALDLRGVEWAVLSACDTGIGQLRVGEGVLGLGRSLRTAGARTLILSLWPVEDEAARAWMKALYEARFGRGFSTAEAVREASLSVIRARRASGASTHPSAWAAFIATGDWR
jgi:CHAT domain-containing protein